MIFDSYDSIATNILIYILYTYKVGKYTLILFKYLKTVINIYKLKSKSPYTIFKILYCIVLVFFWIYMYVYFNTYSIYIIITLKF